MQQLLPKESAYLKTLKQKVQSSEYEDFKIMQALFDELKNHINQGLLTSLQNHHQASVFHALLNQAHAHLQQDNTDAANTLIHSVLTTSLKSFATNHNLNDNTTQTINNALTQAGFYNAIQQQQINTWLSQSTQSNLSLAETQKMLEGLTNFLARAMD
jgi:DNA-binding transcriptional regulator YhcF (GntR family)